MAETVGLRVDDPRFWDPLHLRGEINRVFDICHSCRLCFKFCGSFPTLFELIDGKTEGLRRAYLEQHPELAEAAARKRQEAPAESPAGVEGGHEVGVTFGDELPELSSHARDLTDAEVDRVVDLCFQCRLCYPNCPYTPPHEFAVDFPRLILRSRFHRAKRQGVSLKTRVMRDTALIGKLASMMPRLANWVLRSRANRALMEKVTGIHRQKLMPTYHRQTFPSWWKRHRPRIETPQALREGVESAMPMKVALFSSCLIDYNDPGCGKAAVEVLEHNGVEVLRPAGQVCCGMPFLDEGDVTAAQKRVRQNVGVFADLVARGYVIVVPSPSCSLMVREEFPQIVADEQAAMVARNAYDLNVYLYRIARDGRLKRDFKRRLGRVRYHVPCHLRVQNVGIRGRDLLRLVADEVEVVQECSGHDGTWSMKKENFHDSLRWGAKAFAGMRDEGDACALACSDCRLAALHLKQGAHRATVHPVVALAYAYGFEVDAEASFEGKPLV